MWYILTNAFHMMEHTIPQRDTDTPASSESERRKKRTTNETHADADGEMQTRCLYGTRVICTITYGYVFDATSNEQQQHDHTKRFVRYDAVYIFRSTGAKWCFSMDFAVADVATNDRGDQHGLNAFGTVSDTRYIYVHRCTKNRVYNRKCVCLCVFGASLDRRHGVVVGCHNY